MSYQRCECKEDKRIAGFDMRLMQVESEHMEILEHCFKVCAMLHSAKIQRYAVILKELGEFK